MFFDMRLPKQLRLDYPYHQRLQNNLLLRD